MTRRRNSQMTAKLECTDQTPRESRLGTYTVVAPLARGGTSGVYLGEDLVTRERVALKVLDPFYCDHAEVVDRLLAEHRVSIKARHPALVDVRHADRTTSGVPFLVMEFLDGENLGALHDRGQIEIDAIMAIGAQVAGAIASLHAAGIAHCDIKPDNIIVLYDSGASAWPRVKVIDFGVAKFVEEGAPADSTIAGTPCYMAPEQWRGLPTMKSDVYALGCMLYELVTGDQPFHGTLPQLMLAHHEFLAERPSLRRSNLHPELERLIVRCLAKEPALRPTMSEIEVTLRRLLDEHAQGQRALPATA